MATIGLASSARAGEAASTTAATTCSIIFAAARVRRAIGVNTTFWTTLTSWAAGEGSAADSPSGDEASTEKGLATWVGDIGKLFSAASAGDGAAAGAVSFAAGFSVAA
eukprot:CAMPEP_0119359924 /NCGR_PEP_ID=MMETSP1334-20130426/7683_1 /TAXON_ID=127549 /ORGANISM="Calcidiscus leptoporus, Strain RCC1130" /LENGTH=107 /DNA_ID=CAMNT_0007374679 /DNA_START=683 /DNA_END=1006 /DNA_ORIENTATION=-